VKFWDGSQFLKNVSSRSELLIQVSYVDLLSDKCQKMKNHFLKSSLLKNILKVFVMLYIY
jgi:hypothetical protein